MIMIVVFILIFYMNRMTARLNRTAKKGGRVVRRRRAQTHSKGRGSLAVPDIRDAKAIGQLTSLLNKKNIVLVFIYADWCPHCHTYRDEVWNKLKNVPGRNMAMASVNSDIAETALNGIVDSATRQPARAEGYPTVMLVENASKEAVKIEDARNMTAMSNLVNNANKLTKAVAPNKPAPTIVSNNKYRITAPNNNAENSSTIAVASESVEPAANSEIESAMKASPLARGTEKPIVSPLKLGKGQEDLDELLGEVEPPATAVRQNGGSLLNALRAYERANRNRRFDLQ